MQSLLHNKAMLGIVALLIAVGVWFGLTQSSAPPSSASVITTTGGGTSAPGSSASDADTNNLVQTLLALRSVRLEGTIFSEQTFRSLHDFSTQITSEPTGRDDPFAPTQAQAAVADTAHTVRLFKAPSLFKAGAR